MIQRIQTVWLLLASICGFASLQLPFYYGSIGNLPMENFSPLTRNHLLLLIITIGTALLALINIFLFANRKLQFRISLLGIVLSGIIIYLDISAIKAYSSGGFSISAILTFIMPLLFILAARGIYKDEKLIKSLDRLR